MFFRVRQCAEMTDKTAAVPERLNVTSHHIDLIRT